MKTLLKFTLIAALGSLSTYAARVDLIPSAGIATELSLFGGFVAGSIDTTIQCAGCPAFYSITVESRVYQNTAGATAALPGVYTYVYEVSHTHPPPGTVDILTVASPGFPGTAALNGASGFNYGVADLLA